MAEAFDSPFRAEDRERIAAAGEVGVLRYHFNIRTSEPFEPTLLNPDREAAVLLMAYNIVPDILVQDFFVILHAGLVIGVDASYGSFVGDGEEEEIHESADMEG